MHSSIEQHTDIKQVIDDLIHTATTYDTDTLARIYHDDLEVIMVDADHNVNTATKKDFIAIFDAKRQAGDGPMNTWAEYHHITKNGDNAHVVLSRKNNLNGQDMKLFLDIDLRYVDARWQVTREAIQLSPLAANSLATSPLTKNAEEK